MTMELKKNPRYSLENYSYLFLEIGLVLTLFIVYAILEHKTYDHRQVDHLTNIILNSTDEEELIITHRIEPAKPTPPPPVQLTQILKIVEDDRIVDEAVLESTETDESEAVEAFLELDDIVEMGEAEEIVEDVPFAVIEEVPIFPGCQGEKEELRNCFSEKISEHIHKNFDVSLASDLNLSAGKKRIFTVFTINQKGEIKDIKVKAPHPRLEKEGFRVVNSLPKFTPGKQRGVPVKVKYAMPITFEVINE
jgi:periplasmic protein TonB